MLKRHYAIVSFLRITTDAVTIGVIWNAVYFLRFYTGWFDHQGIPSYFQHLMLIIPIILIFFLCRKSRGVYKSIRIQPLGKQLRMQIESVLLGYIVVILFLYYSQQVPYTRVLLILFLCTLLAGIFCSHLFLVAALRWIRSRGYNQRYYGIVGTGKNALRLFRDLQEGEHFGLQCSFFLDDKPNLDGKKIFDIPVYGRLEQLPQAIRKTGIDELYLAQSTPNVQKIFTILNDSECPEVTIRLMPEWAGLTAFARPSTITVGSCLLFTASESPLTGMNLIVKDIFDRVAAGLLLAVFLIPMGILAILIKCMNGGPVLFRQKRVGLDQREFEMVKFRTMQPTPPNSPGWTVQDDPRLTRMGRFLRRFSLDELPQLLNVLKGQMSLVGPRPEQPHFVKKFSESYKKYMFRHKVKAGMTGWAQIHGFRGDTSLRKRIQYDMYYMQNWSLWLDLLIIFRTPFSILKRKNAY